MHTEHFRMTIGVGETVLREKYLASVLSQAMLIVSQFKNYRLAQERVWFVGWFNCKVRHATDSQQFMKLRT